MKITDGDTLTILDADHRQIKIRLAEIDTPERGQPYGKKSQDELADLVWQKYVAVRVTDVDRYGRAIGRIFVDEVDVSLEMISRGAAWVYRKYASDERLYAYEEEAKRTTRGIWALSEAEKVPPWEWRRRAR